MEKHSTSRLVGSPPGYVGFDEGGQLTEKVRRKPYSVVLLDEIEKAHPEVFNILLQVLEDGRLTDSKGRTVDFRNTVIIMTSNVGAEMIKKNASLGFTAPNSNKQYEDMKDRVLGELKRSFRPEFLNRIDEIIVFHSLNEEHISEIVTLMANQLRNRLIEQGIDFILSDEAKQFLAKEGFDPAYGARPLRRSIQRHIEDRLSEELLIGNIVQGDTVAINIENGSITIEKATNSVSQK
ncbi:MAG TPA: ATP-dependent Clp protease ATP-binding subunit ClpC, partial [Paenibacillaceae bacterium]|nr:ATP-dependent Clp protease ATP-binding subunit ClpC [Paenibacillaceae bacterium]